MPQPAFVHEIAFQPISMIRSEPCWHFDPFRRHQDDVRKGSEGEASTREDRCEGLPCEGSEGLDLGSLALVCAGSTSNFGIELLKNL